MIWVAEGIMVPLAEALVAEPPELLELLELELLELELLELELLELLELVFPWCPGWLE
jgi:hypothetical protein